MKPSVKGWAVAAQQEDLKVKMQADSKAEKKSVVAQIKFFADRELCDN